MAEAHLENRIFFFDVEKLTSDMIIVKMYKTEYCLVKKNGQWENDTKNRMNMSKALIQAVVSAVNA